MAEVFGTIGNESVELNNAATEATLRLLLNAVMAGNKQTVDQIKDMAKKSGLDAEAVEKANQEISRMTILGAQVGASYRAISNVAGQVATGLSKVVDLTNEIASGSGAVSGTLAQFSRLPGIIGLLFTGMSKLAAYQEQLLSTYQGLSNAGVNFGGSLTEMRMAASNTYMTLDQFTNVIKNNHESLSLMGGSVNEGTKSFVRLSKELFTNETGQSLRALGYTTEQVNQSLITYIAMTGGRNREEMKNTTQITKGVTEYLTQLDALTQLTGKSREEQEKALKEANQNAAIQAKLATMDENQKAAYNRGLAEMTAKFGKAGAEMYQAQVLGIPPMTEGAQKLTALAPEVARASQGMADVAKRGGAAADTFRYSAQATQGAVEASKRFSNVAGAMSFQTGSTAEAMMALTKAATQARQQGRESDAQELEARAKIIENQQKQQESQAADAARTQKAMQELGQEIMAKMLPIVSALWNAMNPLITVVTNFFTGLLKIPYLFEVLGASLTLLIGVIALQKAKLAVANVKEYFAGLLTGGRGGAGGPGEFIGPPRPGGPAGRPGGAAAGPMAALSGAGGGIGEVLQGIAKGLGAFAANPQILLGASIFSGAIAIIGAGIAAATWLVGKALPTMAEGFKSFGTLEGDKMVSAGKGIAAIGAGLATFSTLGALSALPGLFAGLTEKLGGFLGIKSPMDKVKEFAAIGPGLALAGMGIKDISQNLSALMALDLSNTKKVTSSLKDIRAASPTGGLSRIGETLAAPMSTPTLSNLPIPTAPMTAPKPATTEATAPAKIEGKTKGITMENLATELQTLNKLSADMVKYLRETAENTKRNIDATKGLSGDLFKA